MRRVRIKSRCDWYT